MLYCIILYQQILFYLNILLSNTFDKIKSILTGVTSACFKHDGKIENFMKLLILSQMKFENIP